MAGERIGEHDGERAARSTVANCAELPRSRVTTSCHTVIAADRGDSPEDYRRIFMYECRFHTEEVTGLKPVSPTAFVQVEALSEEVRQSLSVLESGKRLA